MIYEQAWLILVHHLNESWKNFGDIHFTQVKIIWLVTIPWLVQISQNSLTFFKCYEIPWPSFQKFHVYWPHCRYLNCCFGMNKRDKRTISSKLVSYLISTKIWMAGYPIKSDTITCSKLFKQRVTLPNNERSNAAFAQIRVLPSYPNRCECIYPYYFC